MNAIYRGLSIIFTCLGSYALYKAFGFEFTVVIYLGAIVALIHEVRQQLPIQNREDGK